MRKFLQCQLNTGFDSHDNEERGQAEPPKAPWRMEWGNLRDEATHSKGWVLMGSTGSHWFPLGPTGFCCIPLGSAGFHAKGSLLLSSSRHPPSHDQRITQRSRETNKLLKNYSLFSCPGMKTEEETWHQLSTCNGQALSRCCSFCISLHVHSSTMQGL